MLASSAIATQTLVACGTNAIRMATLVKQPMATARRDTHSGSIPAVSEPRPPISSGSTDKPAMPAALWPCASPRKVGIHVTKKYQT